MLRSQKGHEKLFPVPLDTLIAIMLYLIATLHKQHALFAAYKENIFFNSWQADNRKSPPEVGC